MALRRAQPGIQPGRWITAVLLLVLVVGGVSQRVEADSAAARIALQKRYDAWAAAYLKNDAETLVGMLSPDFTLKTGSGRVLTRRQYAAILRKRSPDAPVVTAYATRIKRLELSTNGNRATAYTTETTTEKAPPAPQAKNPAARSATTHVHEYRDRWVRSRGRWLLQSSETLGESSH